MKIYKAVEGVYNRVGCTGEIKPKSEWLYGSEKAKINVFKMELSFLYTLRDNESIFFVRIRRKKCLATWKLI